MQIETESVNWLDFISSVIASLAWPVVTLIAVLVLRQPLARLLPTLRRAKYKGFDLEFGERLDELEERADEARLPEPVEPPAWVHESPDDWTFGDYIERLAPVSPRVAITEAWRHVELALKDAGARIGQPKSQHLARVARELQSAGRLSRDAVSLVDDLRGLRNRAAHAREFDLEPEQALEFARLAERLIASINLDAAVGGDGEGNGGRGGGRT